MKVTYDPNIDIIRIVLRDISIEKSDEISPGVIADFDEEDNVIGIEILNASKCMDSPHIINFTVSESAQSS